MRNVRSSNRGMAFPGWLSRSRRSVGIRISSLIGGRRRLALPRLRHSDGADPLSHEAPSARNPHARELSCVVNPHADPPKLIVTRRERTFIWRERRGRPAFVDKFVFNQVESRTLGKRGSVTLCNPEVHVRRVFRELVALTSVRELP